jgi:ubiquinol oxidase
VTITEPTLEPPAVGPPELTPDQRRAEQRRSLLAPRRRYGRAARVLFFVFDLSYGRPRTLSKLRALHVAARAHADEVWHLPVIEDLVDPLVERRGFVRFRLLPHLLAFVYHDLSWLLCAVRPSWRDNLGADVHDYAEHEFALFVQEHPELEAAPCDGRFESVADLLRRVARDERISKLEALDRIRRRRSR